MGAVVRNFLIALSVALVLFAGYQPPRTAAVPVTAPAGVAEVGELAPAVPLSVPLAISETTTPPGWTPPPPPTPEQEILGWFGIGWDVIKWQLVGVVFVLLFLLMMVIAIEKSRQD
jgi:hypothetical protein